MEIERCPYCNHSNCVVGSWASADGCWVECLDCGWKFPLCENKDEAIDHFNFISSCVRAFDGVDVNEVIRQGGSLRIIVEQGIACMIEREGERRGDGES